MVNNAYDYPIMHLLFSSRLYLQTTNGNIFKPEIRLLAYLFYDFLHSFYVLCFTQVTLLLTVQYEMHEF